MKAQVLSLGMLAAAQAVASNVYWTDDEDLFHSVDVPTLFGNFTEETKHLTWDGQGLQLEGVMFHRYNNITDNPDARDGTALLPRGSGIHCQKTECAFSGPQYLNSVQEGEFGNRVCSLLKSFSPGKPYGDVAIYATGAGCRDGVHCSLDVSVGFVYNDKSAAKALIDHCHKQVNAFVNKCAGAPGSLDCKNGSKQSNLAILSFGATKKKLSCKSVSGSNKDKCKQIKCDSGNNNCQSF